ncbi:hypothetical protein ACT6NV_12715 [Robiginitalea sp. IMCC44478]|uniref:hypothetical protein n=1 Tax=Robiginitalea sp. IMCC44478 TaxID=3459122 RepID=UPI004042687B
MKTLKISTLLIAVATLFVGCSKDEADGNGLLRISAKASVSENGTALTAKSVNTDVTVTDFRMNLKEFELEIEESEYDENEMMDDSDSWNDDGYYDFEDEIELEGPFELDLLQGEISFITTEVPNGAFEELEFKFDESDDPTSDLFGKSVLIQGTVNEVPFIFWHNFEDEVEVDFENPEFDIVIRDNTDGITIDFDLSQIFDVVSGVDLAQAVDGNENGTIEISPDNADGNGDLAQLIRERIKTAIDLLDD